MPQPPYEIDLGGPDTLPRWFAAGRDASLAIIERFRVEALAPTMFHYTSSAALISIMRNNELWLSDATFLNDRAELEHGRRIAQARLLAAASWDGAPEVQAMMKTAQELFETKTDPVVYVACFSWEPDDLAQWRGYGRGDAPIAIELEYGPLMFGYTSEGTLHEVRYEQEEQSWTFDQVLKAYWNAYSEDVRNPMPSLRPDPMPIEEERALCAGRLYHHLWSYIVACKNPAFRSEREVRFTYIAHDFASSGRGWYPEHPAPMFRERGGLIIPYLSSSNLNLRNLKRIGEVPPLPIRSVRIGPVGDQALVARGVRRLLNAHGYSSVEVTQSGVPFRPR